MATIVLASLIGLAVILSIRYTIQKKDLVMIAMLSVRLSIK